MAQDGRDVAMVDAFRSSEQAGNEQTPHETDVDQSTSSASRTGDEGPGTAAANREERPVTPLPPPPPASAGHKDEERSHSSQESIVAAPHSTGTSPPRPAKGNHLYLGSMPESPDPLLISPVASAASSAGRARAQADLRARSVSAEPGRGYLRSSPSRVVARQRSKTPSAKDVTGENADPASDEVLAAAPTPGQRRLSRPPEPDAGSDDQLAMSPLRAAPPRGKLQGRGDFVGVEIPPARRSRPTRPRNDTASPQGLHSRSPQVPDQSSSNTLPQAGSSARRTASFELIVDTPRAASRSPKTSPRASPVVRDDEAAIVRDFAAQHLSTSSSHPLSQVHSRESLAADSSPLTSIAATSPVRRHTPEPVASPTKRSRRKVKDATYTADSDDDGAETSSTVSNPSPKKKRKPRVAARKTATAMGNRRTSTGRNRKKEEEAELDERSPSPTQANGDSTDLVLGKSDRPRRDRKGKAKAAEPEGEDIPPAVREAAAAANRSTRRRSAIKASYKEAGSGGSDEEEAEGGSTFESEPQETSPRKRRGRPRKTVESDTTPRAQADRKPKVKGRLARAAAAPESKRRAENPASGSDAPTPLSSPSKRNGLSAPEAFGSQSSSQGRASRQTAEQRKAGWSKYAFSVGQPLWVHVCPSGKHGFWWPGEITSTLLERPLKVKLYIDTAETVGAFSEESLSIGEPDHDTLATFRNPAKLRFDKYIFRDEDDAMSGSAPSDDAFAEVLEMAVEREAEADGEGDDDDDEEMLASPAAPEKASTRAPTARKGVKAKKPVEDASADELEGRPAPAQSDESDFDEILDVDDADSSFEVPFICLAFATHAWWPARCIAQVPGSPSKKGRGANRKFKVEFTDSSIKTLAPKSVLTPKQKKFFTVKLGETELALDSNYVARTKSFVTTDMLPVYQEIIDERYAYARDRNDDFFAGGQRRERLAQRSVFGELPDEVVEMVLEVISSWADGEGSADGRPRGSDRYNALSPVERVQYRADVLLPLAIIENYADDGALPDKADELLRQAGVTEPTEDECKLKGLAMAEADLDRRSVTKAVLAMRNARKNVRGSRKSRA